MKIQLFELSTTTKQEILEFEAVIKDGNIIAVKTNTQTNTQNYFVNIAKFIKNYFVNIAKFKKNYFVNIAKFITEESVENAIDKKQYYYMLPFIEESGERFYQMTVCFNV